MVLDGPGCKFLRREPVEARVWSHSVVQLDATTPTLPNNAKFIIHGILGAVAGYLRMKRSIRRARKFFAAVFPAWRPIAGWRFQSGCSTAPLAPVGVLWLRR